MSNSLGMRDRFTNGLFRLRPVILTVFVAITLVMFWSLSQLRVDAGFLKQLPLDHEYMKTFMQYEREFGGANRVMVALVAEDGEMFTPEFFESLEAMTQRVFFIPGVERGSVRSIFTPNVRFVEVVEDGFAGGNVIPADFRPTPEAFERVRGNIVASGEVGRLVAEDFSGAMVWANLIEGDVQLPPFDPDNPCTDPRRFPPPQDGSLNYQQVACFLEALREDFERDGHTVHIIGFAKIVGDIADGARGVVTYFGLAFVITAILLFLYSGSVWLTVLPLICSVVAVIWQLGALRFLGFGIDPMNILTPFLVFAIGVSHGVQMISGWNSEKLFGGKSPMGLVKADIPLESVPIASSLDASKATFKRLLVPGSIALISDTIGFLTILLINIRIIQELAITASIGVAIIIFTNLVLLPVLLSYVRLARVERFRQRQYDHGRKSSLIWNVIASFTRPRVALVTVAAGISLFAFAWIQSQNLQIGDSQPGVPELRADARYNQDARLIAERFSVGTDLISIIAETVPEACTESFAVMEAIDRFSWRMANVEGVQQVVSLPMVAKTINAGWNEGNIRWKVLPRNAFIMRQNLQDIETGTGLLNHDCSAMPIMVFTEDHKAETIIRVVNAVRDLRAEIFVEGLDFVAAGSVVEDMIQQDGEPCEECLRFRLATGNVGVMAATNEVVEAAQTPMLIYVYAAIIILCLLTFRSVLGTLCIVLPLVLVSYLAYALMAFMGIGLKVNTLPVVALGVGIGVDYGIYIFSRMRSLMDEGFTLDEAYLRTLRLTGRAVFITAITLAVGVGTWLFSDLQFQADMGVLLAFMFFFNMVGAMVLLPALARILLAWKEPNQPAN